MSTDDPLEAREELVFVVDLTTDEIERIADGIDDDSPTEPKTLPPTPPEPIGTVALLLDGWEEPLLLPVEPTRDVERLDALARLLRIAVLAGERVPTVAVEYGDELERTLIFERKLPGWVYDGVAPEVAVTLPPEVQRVLSPRPPRR